MRTIAKAAASVAHPEYQYLQLINNIMEHGDTIKGRNGVTKSIFGQ